MTDKIQKIRKKVEKLMYGFNLEADIASCEDAETEKLADIKYQLCKKILDYIDEVQKEPVSEDLKKAAEDYGIRQGAELKPFAIKYFKAGAKWQKEQMMKNAVDNTCMVIGKVDDHINVRIGVFEKPHEIWHCKCDTSKFKIGDKVKVIVIKEY